MKLKRTWIVLFGALAIFACVVVVISGGGASTRASTIPIPPTPLGAHVMPIPSSHPGLPAIQHQGLHQASTVSVPITLSDVKTYVKSHVFHAGPAITGVTARATAIYYITSKEASQKLMGGSIGIRDTMMVYYVEWQGPFLPINASVPPGKEIKPVDRGVEVYDATTGNLLLWWVPNF